MRRTQLFAAAVSVALVFGASAPAMAKPGKAKAKGHETAAKPAKEPKAPKAPKVKGLRINGGGMAGAAEFSVNVRSDHPKKGQKGHFNYTVPGATPEAEPLMKIRCKSVAVAVAPAVQEGDKAATVTGSCKEGSGKAATPVSLTATFYDNAAGDRADIVFTRNGVASSAHSGPIVGDIHVR